MYNKKSAAITAIITNYLEGIYYGNVEKLRKCFVDEAYLYGDIKGAEYLKSLEEYLKGVKNRKSPSQLGEENRMEIKGLEIMGNVAIAKVHVPMLGFNYYDFLSLSMIEGKWKIVNKIFTHVE